MGNVHVSGSLDQDQQIFRFISFYDLIDLLTFSQISFSSLDRMQNTAQDSSFKKKSDSLSIMHQSWILLDREDAIDWHTRDTSQPRICIFSNIRALSESLFTDDATDVFIERTYRVTEPSTQSELLRAKALSVLQESTVSVIVSSTGDSMHISCRPNDMRLLVDLKTLLIGVMVSPDTSIRFLELVSTVVQQSTCAFALRASRPF